MVAELDNKIVGYIWFVWYEHIKDKGVAYLEELYVEDKYRNPGIEKRLVMHALELIKKSPNPDSLLRCRKIHERYARIL